MLRQLTPFKIQNGLCIRYPVTKDWPLLWIVILLATYFRLNALNEPGLWLDEAAYTIAAQKPIIDQIIHPIETLRDSIGSADPVLSAIPFSLALKLGFSNYLARFPAAVFGILSIAIFYRLGRSLFGNRVGLIAALLLCTSSFHLLYSQEARSYSQLTFFTLASFYFFYQGITRVHLRNWALYTLSIGAGISSHYDMAFVIFTQSVFLAIVLGQKLVQPDQKEIPTSRNVGKVYHPLDWMRSLHSQGRKEKTYPAWLKKGGYFLAAVGVVFLLRLLWLEDFLYWSGRTVGGPYPLDLIGNFVRSVQALLGHSGIIIGIYVVLSLLGLIFAFLYNKQGALLLTCWVIISIPITTIGLWYVSQFFHERHIIWSLPGLLLATACGVAELSYLGQKLWFINMAATRVRLAQLGSIGLIVAPLLFINLRQAQQNPLLKQNWPVSQLQAAADHITTQAKVNEVVIGVPNAQYLQLYIQPIRQDLIYLDTRSTVLPPQFAGTWYIFFDVRNVPVSWSGQVDFKRFQDLLVVHRPSPCQLEICADDVNRLFTEMAEANQDSSLKKIIDGMLSGLARLTANK